MLFNVVGLMKEPSGSARSFDVDEAVAVADDGHVYHVMGNVKLLRTDKGVWVSATLATEAPCVCSRCLRDFSQPIRMAIEEECMPLADVLTGARVARPGDSDDNLYVDENHILDMREAFRQYVAINVPMKPICREDCSGICPTCGVNRNESSCACREAPEDARWGALLELVSANGKEKD